MPMQRKFRIVAAAVAGLSLIGLAACGGDDSASNTTTTQAPSDTTAASGTASADDYVATVCSEVEDWASQLQGFGDDLENTGSKDEFIATLGELKDATATLAENVSAAGAPDVDGGEEIAANIVDSITAYEDAVDEATTLAESLPEDVAGAEDGINQIFSDLTDAEGAFAAVLSNVPPALQDAVDAEPACDSLPE